MGLTITTGLTAGQLAASGQIIQGVIAQLNAIISGNQQITYMSITTQQGSQIAFSGTWSVADTQSMCNEALTLLNADLAAINAALAAM